MSLTSIPSPTPAADEKDRQVATTSRGPTLSPDTPPAMPEEETTSIPTTVWRWNDPHINVYRFFAALYSFMVLGMNDACLGPLIPYVGKNQPPEEQ